MTGPMIERIRTYRLRVELSRAEAFAYSQAQVGFRTAMLVEIVADDGRSGWGEAYGPPAPSKTIIDELYAPRLIGRDPMDTTVIWEELYASPRDYGRGGFPVAALSAVDIALWDLKGIALGQPVAKLFGGGFTEALRIGALANTWGVTVYLHVWGSAVGLHASMQWAASLPPNPFALVPGELWFELDRTANPFREGLAAEPLKRAGAIIEVPQRPGLGLEVDRAVVERHAVTTGESRR